MPATSCDTPTSKIGSGGKSVHSPTHGSGIIGPVPPKPPMLMLPACPPRPGRPGGARARRGFDARASSGADDRDRQPSY